MHINSKQNTQILDNAEKLCTCQLTERPHMSSLPQDKYHCARLYTPIHTNNNRETYTRKRKLTHPDAITSVLPELQRDQNIVTYNENGKQYHSLNSEKDLYAV